MKLVSLTLVLLLAPWLQLSEGINDQWLATPKDGTLLAYLPRAKSNELEKACLIRLLPDKFIDIGCF